MCGMFRLAGSAPQLALFLKFGCEPVCNSLDKRSVCARVRYPIRPSGDFFPHFVFPPLSCLGACIKYISIIQINNALRYKRTRHATFLSHFLEISRLRFPHPLFGCVNQCMDSSRKWASRYHFNETRRSVSTSRAATSVTRRTILRRPFKLFTYSDPKFECAFLLLRTHFRLAI